MAQTEQFVLRLGTYGPDLLDDQGQMPEYREQVDEVITPEVRGRLREGGRRSPSSWSPRPASPARPRSSPPASRRIDGDSATALVAGDASPTPTRRTSEPAAGARRRSGSRSTLVKIDGDWLVDDFTPVTRRPTSDRDPRARAGTTCSASRRDASADEIRAAWRAAIADLDPTDRRFGAYNQAAEVLLDPERRAAYDAELARRRPPSRAASPSRSRSRPPSPQPRPGRRAGARDGGRRRACPAGCWSCRRRRWPLVVGRRGCWPSRRSRRTPASRSDPRRRRAPPSGRSCRSCPTTPRTSTRTRLAAEAYLTGGLPQGVRQALRRSSRRTRPQTGTVVERRGGRLRHRARRRRPGRGAGLRQPADHQQAAAASRWSTRTR